MTTAEKTTITVSATINAPIGKVWKCWTGPIHIMHWNNASDDWHTTYAENDLRAGGKFVSRMEARDGSFGFDFEGKYTTVEENKRIDYAMSDGRTVKVSFTSNGNETIVTETFDAEQENSIDMQRQGWQAILNNFKSYVEKIGKPDALHFEIEINAPVEHVYKTMLEDKPYREWTAEFNPTSYYKGSLEKGSKILFLGSDKDGNQGGMVSRIKENMPNKFVSFEHLGIVKGEQEITTGADIEQWAGAFENYTFKGKDGKTVLSVDMDTNEEFESYFAETWPKALKKLRAICER